MINKVPEYDPLTAKVDGTGVVERLKPPPKKPVVRLADQMKGMDDAVREQIDAANKAKMSPQQNST